MTKADVIRLLIDNKNEWGIRNWEKFRVKDMSAYGLGLTQLKKLAREVGRNHERALELWEENNYDVRTMSLLTEEPKKVSREQLESMVKSVGFWMLSHTFVQNLLSKVPYRIELGETWRKSNNEVKRRCGFLLLYYLAKDDKSLDDHYFEPIVEHICKYIQQEENFVKDAMNNALLMIGQRSGNLYKIALNAAQKIGPVDVDYGDNSCKAVNVVEHLSGTRIKQKLNLISG